MADVRRRSSVSDVSHDPDVVNSCREQAKQAGSQAGEAVEQAADTAADKTEEAGQAAKAYSKTGQQQVHL